MNGLRQVLWDVFHTERSRNILAWVLFLAWLLISLIGATAIIGGTRQP
jgi:succinate dehydrogenase hydrophobic anchor subunit